MMICRSTTNRKLSVKKHINGHVLLMLTNCLFRTLTLNLTTLQEFYIYNMVATKIELYATLIYKSE